MTQKVKTDAGFLLSLSLAILLIPLKWLLSWLLAAVVHELAHLLAMRCFRCKAVGMRIGICGARIDGEPLPDWAAFLCAAAGPSASLCLVFLARWLPHVAICGFIHGIFNLLPLYPMDGRHMLDRLLSGMKHADVIIAVVRIAVSTVLILCGIWLFRMSLGPLPLLAAALVIWNDRKNTLQKRD